MVGWLVMKVEPGTSTSTNIHIPQYTEHLNPGRNYIYIFTAAFVEVPGTSKPTKRHYALGRYASRRNTNHLKNGSVNVYSAPCFSIIPLLTSFVMAFCVVDGADNLCVRA